MHMPEDGTRPQRPSKETGPLQTRPHKWTLRLLSGERVAKRVEGRHTALKSEPQELPPVEEARAEMFPFAQRGPQTHTLHHTGDCRVSPSAHNSAHDQLLCPSPFLTSAFPSSGQAFPFPTEQRPSPTLLRCTLFWALLTPQSPTNLLSKIPAEAVLFN